MGLRMPTPYRRLKSGNFYFRRRVPADIQRLGMDTSFVLTLPALDGAREFTVVPKIGHEVKFSLRTRDEQVAKARSAFALARLASHYDALRKGPTPLSHKQIVALSGEVFHFFRQKYEENPGKEKDWTAVKAFNRATLEGRLLNVPPLDESIDRHHLMAG